MFPHAYGQGAVAPLPPSAAPSPEVGLVLEVVASDAALARTVAAVFKQNLLHHGYPGRLSTAGNLAFPFTPSELDGGPAFRFVLYHRLDGAQPSDIFRIRAEDVGASAEEACR